MYSLLAALVALVCVVTNVLGAKAPEGTLHRRSYQYVGGSFIQQGSSTLVHGQMYVEHLVPVKVTQPLPLLFIEGVLCSQIIYFVYKP